MPVQCPNQLSYEVTGWVRVNLFGSCFPLKRNVVWKKRDMKCGVWNQMKIWSSHLLDNFKQLSHEPENFSGDSTGFEPMTSAMPVQCSNQLSYEVTQLRAGQFVWLMFSLKKEWRMKEMRYEVWCLKSNEDMILARAGQSSKRKPCKVWSKLSLQPQFFDISIPNNPLKVKETLQPMV